MTDLKKLADHLKANFPLNSLAIIDHNDSFWGSTQIEIHYDPADSIDQDRITIMTSIYYWKIEYTKKNKTIAKIEVGKESHTDEDFKLISEFINPLIITKK